MKLLIDLDGCIFPTYQELNVLHKALFQEEINWQALPDRSNPYWNTRQGQWVRRMFNNDLFYSSLLAYKGAREALRIWNKNPANSIVYCTSRGLCLEAATAYSIGRNNLPYGDMIFVERENVAKAKRQIAMIEGAVIAIEDEFNVVVEMAKTCITLLYTQPYNANLLYQYRVHNWLEIHRVINTSIGGERK